MEDDSVSHVTSCWKFILMEKGFQKRKNAFKNFLGNLVTPQKIFPSFTKKLSDGNKNTFGKKFPSWFVTNFSLIQSFRNLSCDLLKLKNALR